MIKPREQGLTMEDLYATVLLPLDGSNTGESAIPYVVALAEKFHCEVILMHVVEEGRNVHTIGGLQYIRFIDQDVQIARDNAGKYLRAISSRFENTGAKIDIKVTVGDVAREILKEADAQENCLIALSSHGHSGINAFSFGSVTQKIANSTSRPFLIIRAV